MIWFSMTRDSRAFRDALGRFPTGVTVITTTAEDGRPVAVTIGSFTSVSLEPPLVLFCLAHQATCRPVFRACSRFVVNLLSEEQREHSIRFATPPGDRWEGLKWTRSDNGLPVFVGCLVTLECDVEAIHNGGDHDIIIGQVRRIGELKPGRPLLHFKGAYRALAEASAIC
jgi:flavin reductase (DIM6/NTAB) family NADH-FMN oxidoreductase RutF